MDRKKWVFAPNGTLGVLMSTKQSKDSKVFYTWIRKMRLLSSLLSDIRFQKTEDYWGDNCSQQASQDCSSGTSRAQRACTLHPALVRGPTSGVKSKYDGVLHNIYKHLECSTPNVVFYIKCVCVAGGSNVGSTVDMKGRWRTHIRHSNWTACSLARHFGQNHQQDLEASINKL